MNHTRSREVDVPVEAIVRYIDAHEEDIVTFAQDLMRIPTVNAPPYGEEKDAQEFLAGELRRLGLEPDLFYLDSLEGLREHPAYCHGGSVEIPRDYADRPDLVCVWSGQGQGRSLIVTGHIDVVPPGDLNRWQHDPWAAMLDEDKIYARGAIDDKGPLAALFMAVTCLHEIGVRLRGDLILQSFVDEEFGGGNGALATLVRGYSADGAIMLEPTDLAVCPTTYGCGSLHVQVRGRSAHPIQRSKGIDAIGLGCQVYRSFLELESRRGSGVKEWPLFEGIEIPVPLVVRRFEALTPGGGAVADLCEMQVWTTVLPGETQASLLTQVREHLAETLSYSSWLQGHPPEVRSMGRFLEATTLPVDHELVSALRLAYEQCVGHPPELAIGTSGDGYIYANYGHMPTVELGPGSIHRAHAPDEFISVDELVTATKVIALSIANWCGIA
jgi:acetylornithine deacetylase